MELIVDGRDGSVEIEGLFFANLGGRGVSCGSSSTYYCR